MTDQAARSAVFDHIRQIPAGNVSTYKIIASAVGIHARQVGRILHTNTNPEVYPCHRVVHSDGSTAAGFVFGGLGKQQALLEAEGVTFQGNRVVLGSHLYSSF